MLRYFLSFACLGICTSCSAQSLPSAGQLDAKLHAAVPEYSVSGNTFIAALLRVADEFQIPLGVEWVATSSAVEKLSLSWHDTSVINIVEVIVHSQPGYEVRVDGSILHVTSTAIPRGQDFLNLTVHSFDVQEQVVQIAERQLRSAIAATVAPQKVGGILGSLATSPNEPSITIKREDASVREILDSLISVSRKKIWVVTFVDSATSTTTGFDRTMTLWNHAPVPDSEQPLWDLFSWDEPLPAALNMN
jgi:hypothetical protein